MSRNFLQPNFGVAEHQPISVVLVCPVLVLICLRDLKKLLKKSLNVWSTKCYMCAL